ncbi:hypothetical protein [Mesorhizobium sp. NZP2077]|nr:hypothetical protein [Mesorhizobium sp. NZP2077]
MFFVGTGTGAVLASTASALQQIESELEGDCGVVAKLLKTGAGAT